jgi:hypothetical protein
MVYEGPVCRLCLPAVGDVLNFCRLWTGLHKVAATYPDGRIPIDIQLMALCSTVATLG